MTLRRKDNSENIFDEFLKSVEHSSDCNGKIFIFYSFKIIL